jgi:hypothetical protein
LIVLLVVAVPLLAPSHLREILRSQLQARVILLELVRLGHGEGRPAAIFSLSTYLCVHCTQLHKHAGDMSMAKTRKGNLGEGKKKRAQED